MENNNENVSLNEVTTEYIPKDEDFVPVKNHDINTDTNFSSTSYWKGVIQRFFKKKRSIIGLCIVAFIVVFAILGPYMTDYEYDEIIAVEVNGSEKVATSISPRISFLHTKEGDTDWFAGYTFILGTDTVGRDIWTRTWYGARVSLIIALVTIVIDVIIGMSYGLVSGYFGGAVDALMQRIVEIANSIPRLVIVAVLALLLPANMLGIGIVIVTLILTEWIGMSKIARAEMLKIKDQEYILASRTLGAGNFSIIFKDILPNTVGPIITQVMFSIPTAIFTEAFLSFVGVGIQLPKCSIGSLIEDGFKNIQTLPYQIFPPAIVLALLMLGFNFIGDGLREALAPKIEDM